MANICTSNTLLIIGIVATSLTEVIALPQAVVLVNESAFMSCFSKELKGIQWHHTPPGKKSNEFIYAEGGFYPPYNTGRFRVNNDPTTNMHTLVIANIMHEDAGLYECKDDVGLLSGVFGSTNLTVLDSSPICTSNVNPNGFVGPNTCNIDQENMTFSCAVSFSGNSPNLTWSTLNGSHALSSSICESKDNRINCSLSVKADPSFDGSTFICQTTTSNDARYNCNIEDIRVEYFFGDDETAEKRVGDNVTCVVASNLQIHYNWTIQEYNEENIFRANRTIYFQKPGSYKCSVKYKIRNVSCHATIVDVNVVDDEETVKSFTVVTILYTVLIYMHTIFVANTISKYIHDFKDDAVRQRSPLRSHRDILSDIGGTTSLQSNFEAQRNKLEEIVESRFGLLSILRSSKVLTPTDQEEIEGKYTTKSKNQKLLDLIFEKGNYQKFIHALRSSGQTHVVNWINGNGVYERKFDLDWPLTDKEIDILDRNYNWLGENLSLKEGLNGTLFSMNVINVRQRDLISSKPTSCEANEAFLKILRQSSLTIYYLTARCLRDLNDGHIATVLENFTATVPIHVTLVGESVVETEEQILDEVVKLRLEKNASLEEEDVDIFLARLRLRLIAAKKGGSIVLFVSCFNIREFRHLCTKVDKSEMKKILERLFHLLLQNLQPKVLLVTITESDRENAEEVFKRECLRDKKYDGHFQRLRSQLKYKELKEPMEMSQMTTEESVDEREGEELPQESKDPSTSASVEDSSLFFKLLCIVIDATTSRTRVSVVLNMFLIAAIAVIIHYLRTVLKLSFQLEISVVCIFLLGGLILGLHAAAAVAADVNRLAQLKKFDSINAIKLGDSTIPMRGGNR